MKYCIIVIAATMILLWPNIINAQIIEGMKPAEMGEVIPFNYHEPRYNIIDEPRQSNIIPNKKNIENEPKYQMFNF